MACDYIAMNFFGSIYCENMAHCETCRALVAGRQWRSEIRDVFTDIHVTDFDCPHGKPWAELPDPDQPFKEAKAAIEAAPYSGVWAVLKAQLHEVETAEYPATGECEGNCARNRERAKLVNAYKELTNE